uniref:DUF659 domain-containing protein n=1 Tax=Ditylenchus dipsaci TaxID=166011 RepID=A0A915DWQ6_9BILA
MVRLVQNFKRNTKGKEKLEKILLGVFYNGIPNSAKCEELLRTDNILKSSNAMRCRICKGNNKDHIVERNDLGTKGLGSHLYYIHRKEFDKLVHQSLSFVTQKRVGMSTQMDTLVAKFIINKNLCFSVVEDASFSAILEKAFPGHTRKKLSDEIIPTMADKMSQDLSNQMSGQIVALTSDGWQNLQVRRLFKRHCNWVDSKFKRHDYVLAVNPYRAGTHIDSVVGLVRDDASNMRPSAVKQDRIIPMCGSPSPSCRHRSLYCG